MTQVSTALGKFFSHSAADSSGYLPRWALLQRWHGRMLGDAGTMMVGRAPEVEDDRVGRMMSSARRVALTLCLILLSPACGMLRSGPEQGRIRVLLDTDANNEVDDQHALAYMLFSGGAFDIAGITVNRTRNGGDVEKHAQEAERIVKLAGLERRFTVARGANGSFNEIARRVDQRDFDGAAAVNLIIQRAHESSAQPLVLLPVGKLTNIALALKKDPSIASKVRIVWLGSNYPEPGEYNQENDEAALQYVLDVNVPFEIALVRYGTPSGTAAVRVTREEIRSRMPGKGPHIQEPVVGRNGGRFTSFGDYSVDLFEHIELDGNPPSRALFDMAAVAIVKNPAWAHPVRIPAPRLVDGKWVARPDNRRTIVLWENFDRAAIIQDFYKTMDRPVLAR